MEYIWYIIAALGAGIGTGLAGLSAATVMVPILIAIMTLTAESWRAAAVTSVIMAVAIYPLLALVETWKYIIVDGMLGLYPFCFCPHYNEEGRDSFDQMISDVEYDGLALENETAFVESSGQQFIIGARHDAKAWLFSNHNKQQLEGVQPLIYDASMAFPFRVNLIPFVNIFDYDSKRDLLLNVIGNTAMFIPSGIVLPIIYKKLNSFWKVVAAGAMISLCIEIIQLPFSVRASDVDDLILNTLGVVIGYGIYAAVKHLKR